MQFPELNTAIYTIIISDKLVWIIALYLSPEVDVVNYARVISTCKTLSVIEDSMKHNYIILVIIVDPQFNANQADVRSRT